MLAVDIEAFGALPNDDFRQRLRDEMHGIVRDALERANLGVERTTDPRQMRAADLGDGVLYVVNAEHTGVLVDCVASIRTRVRRFNDFAGTQARLRLRVVVHAGEVEYDDRGATGGDLIEAFRLLNSAALHKRLRKLEGGDLVLMVSDYIFDHVVRQEQCDHFSVDDFDRVKVRLKETRTRAAVYPRLRELPAPEAVPWLAAAGNATRGFVREHTRALLRGLLALALGAAAGLTATPLVLAPVFGDCPVPTQLVFMASPSISDTIEGLAEDFISDQDGACRRANVQVFSVPTFGAAAEHVGSGWALDSAALPRFGPEPAVWIPDATAVTHQPLRELDGRNMRHQLLGSVARSPVVLAADPAFMQRLTPEPSATWEEIRSWLPLVDDGTAQVARAAPTTSAAALLAAMQLFGQVRDAAGRAAMEARIQPATADEPTELCDMGLPAEGSPQQPQAMFTSERFMTTRNAEGAEACGPAADDQTLTAVYPRDGQGRTPVLDYPYVLLPAAFEHDERLQLAKEFFDDLREPEAQAALREDGFRDLNRVADRGAAYGADQGQPDRALGQPDLAAVHQTTSQWDAARPAARVLLAIDVSQSMDQALQGEDGNRLSAARAAAGQFVDQMTSRDHLVLWKFADNFAGGHPHEELASTQDGAAAGGARFAQIQRQLQELRLPDRSRGTKLYETVTDGIGRLRGSGAPGDVRAMVVVTDGGEGLRRGVGDEAMLQALNDEAAQDVLIFLLVLGPTGCDAAELDPLSGHPAVRCVRGDAGLAAAFAEFSAVLFGS